MRAFRLVSVSLEAERVLLGLQAKRFAVKAVLGLVAAVFLIAAFAMLHVLAWLALEPQLSPLARAGVILAGDLVIAGILLALALRDNPSRQEIEARMLRDNAFSQARASFGLLPMLGGMARSPLLGMIIGMMSRRKRG
ncbi:hypothetical protein [Teichococcus aestuarii]|uniref:Phage holin family protein n=1 Tax=Teichococcus aestuarii TaxID=568898 RepID=A0A2U1V7X2_9PROT|nr:hypothetical protein [Pseudoroseomonas aestuarii]PWC30009.1 hypothetical protein CR165_03850 [Pseudoroseomonas aestuarii]